MPIGCGRPVNRPAQIQALDHGLGRAAEHLAHGHNDGFVRDLAGAESVHGDGYGLRHADGVGELDLTAFGKARGHDILGDVAAHIGGAAIHLAGVLAGEGAAAVVARATVGVDDDLAAGKAGIAHGPAHHEAPGGVHVVDGLFIQQFRGQRGLDHILQDAVSDGVLGDVLVVLGGDDNRVDALHLAALELDGDLALAIRAQPRQLVALADLGEAPSQQVGVVDGGRH